MAASPSHASVDNLDDDCETPPLQRIAHGSSVWRVSSLAFSGVIAVSTACLDGFVCVHNAQSAQLICKSAKLARQVYSVCADADPGVLLAGPYSPHAIHSVLVADGSSRVLVADQPGSVHDLVFIKSVNAVAAFIGCGLVRVFARASWEMIA